MFSVGTIGEALPTSDVGDGKLYMMGEFMGRDELLELLCRLFPAFRPYWHDEENCFKDLDDYSVHGICACFSHYFSEDFGQHNDAALSQLFASFEAIIVCDKGGDNTAANAVTTCFLENMAGTVVGERARTFMGEESRRYFEYWKIRGGDCKT